MPSMSARSLAKDFSSIIAVITHLTPQNMGSTTSDPFLGAIVDCVERRTRAEGYYLMVRSVEDARSLTALSHSWRLSGLILTGMFQDEFFEETVRLGIPFVLIDSYVDAPGVYKVGLEDEKGGYIAGKRPSLHCLCVSANPGWRSGGYADAGLSESAGGVWRDL